MILYLDTETTGLTPGNICQLTYIMQTEEYVTAKNFFFTVDYVEPSAEKVHGFSVEKLKILSKGKRFCDRVEEIKKDFESADVIICHNSAFDFSFLESEFNNCNEEFSYKDVICSMKSFSPILKLPKTKGYGYKYPSLDELCSYAGLSDEIIKTKTEELFETETFFHDARFDTVALCLCINVAYHNKTFPKNIAHYLESL